jgi:hypothetical protein
MTRSIRRRRIGQAVVLALVVALAGGCTPGATPDPSVATNTQPPETSTGGTVPGGVVHEELSDNFRVTVYSTTLYAEGSTVRISYRVEVVNKTQETFHGFYPTVVLDPELDQYLAAGVTPLPISTRLNVYPEGHTDLDDPVGAAGVDIDFDQVVSDRQFLADAGLDVDRLFELGEHVTLWLRWDDGEERLTYSTPVEDPNHLFSS